MQLTPEEQQLAQATGVGEAVCLALKQHAAKPCAAPRRWMTDAVADGTAAKRE
jgi:hypothetical protein